MCSSDLELGMDIVHVPYKASAGAITDLVGGQVQATVSSLQTTAPHVASGKLRMLGVLSPERPPAFPDAPTMREQGLSNLEVDTWYGVFAPAGTPQPIVQRVNEATGNVLRQPELIEALRKAGFEPAPSTPAALGAQMKGDIEKWGRLAKAAKVQKE